MERRDTMHMISLKVTALAYVEIQLQRMCQQQCEPRQLNGRKPTLKARQVHMSL